MRGRTDVHPALAHLIAHALRRGTKTKLTTNGIAISDEAVAALRMARSRVRVSLHGDREHHDRIVGRQAFDRTTHNLSRLLVAGIHTSVQTTVVARHGWVVDWVAEFCLKTKVRQLSILTFIPRGNGKDRRAEYELSATERSALRETVSRKRRELSGRLDMRWLDFTMQPVPVVEADGRVIFEHATEAVDVLICQIPKPAIGADLGLNLRHQELQTDPAPVMNPAVGTRQCMTAGAMAFHQNG